MMKNHKANSDCGISICRPGFGASCALCCGSHNYAASRAEIEILFRERKLLFSNYSREYIINQIVSSRSGLTGSYYYTERKHPFIITLPPLHTGCLQCPYAAFIDDNNTAGCFLYSSDDLSTGGVDCFNSYRSRHFICRAKETLTEDEIMYAALLTRDWFYYPLLIHNHPLLKQLMSRYIDPNDIGETDIEKIKNQLLNYLAENKELHTIHTYFG